ncbi:MAG: branched-chain amino acid aminotransferase [Mycobacteriales bacterium]
MSTAWPFRLTRATDPVPAERRAQILAEPGFGRFFTDHMVTVEWTSADGWTDAHVGAYGPLTLAPSTSALHYGQAIFEGFKAFRQPDGGIALFRPEANAHRFQRSAQRLALPELPVALFVQAAEHLVALDREWVPDRPETSLYLRPLMIGTEAALGVRPSSSALFVLLASPAGAYFSGGAAPVTLWLSEEYVRAAPGGTGAAKCAGNYAASLVAQREAADHGCEQVVFLDAAEHCWVEELGGMNLFFVCQNGALVTPPASGTILAGITRDSLLTLARELGHPVTERGISVEEWRASVSTGAITEVFACGTAAVITPVGALRWTGGEVSWGDGGAGPVTGRLRQALVDIQYGRTLDRHGWMHPVTLT